MSFFYRKPGAAVDSRWNPTVMKVLTTAPLILYPLGCIVRLHHAPDTAPVMLWIAGLGPIVVALLCFALVAPSYLQRLTGEQSGQLDEFEMNLRRKAYTFSYHVFATLALVLCVYLYVVTDAAKLDWAWRPTTSDHWEAILWGGILYSLLIPTAYLAWTLKPVDEEADEAA